MFAVLIDGIPRERWAACKQWMTPKQYTVVTNRYKEVCQGEVPSEEFARPFFARRTAEAEQRLRGRGRGTEPSYQC